MNLDDKAIIAWNNAENCNCDIQDCAENHKICYLCGDTIIYGAHESVKNQRNSKFKWNIDHIIPKSQGGTNSNDNIIVVHVKCNRRKADS
ncbi:HNH endonuclease [Spiroplasma endosymbiont of Ammophila pubescens]|uniref:HNH endonuclease n=1 Tax=Spiroplasma endosymbiont of Ammophila pubescens TaxID=3066315 RepID=UPI0032B173FE